MLYALIFLLFLCLGSFLNVVIYRLPREINLALPRSYCPSCRRHLYFYHNIPVLSFLILKARCSFCRKKISWQYFIVELAAGLTGIVLFLKFGLTFSFFAGSVFSLILISLIFIDIEHQILPDILTLGLLWLGLTASLFSLFISSHDAIIGAGAGYISLWTVAVSYEKISGTEGMGHGDFKLLAAMGAWTGWQNLLNIILFASLTALITGIYLIAVKKANGKTPLAFGPYIAAGGWLALMGWLKNSY